MSFLTTFLYDGAGNRTSVEDANGKLTTSLYFSNRNLVETTLDAMGFRTTYAHDLQGRLQSTQDANGNFVTNVYDSMGRLQLVKNALGENARQYGYDLAGRMVTYADAANRVRTYTYDQAGQNTAIQFPDGRIATHAYDALGRRTTMSDWGGISTYAFDARGQMSGKTASGYVQAYDYDANGNRTTLSLGGVGVITYVFDTLNRLTSAQKPTGERYTLAYDVDSRRTTMQLGNGTTRAYAYDANSRLTTQIELNGVAQLVTIVDSYDPVGNRIGRNLDGVVTTWTYDDLYRLTHQNKPGQVCTYVLDPVGNLEVMWEGGANPKTFTFDAADRLVTMVEGTNTTTYTYTGYGALEVTVDSRGTRTTNTYDGQDQLIKVQRGGGGVVGTTSTYTFDGDGMRRTAQEGNVAPTTMVWDGSDYLFLDGPSSDQLVLTLDGEIVACGSKDLLTDPLGTLVREISAGASLSSAFSFYPYGSPVTGTTPTIPFRFIAAYGYYFDTNDRDYVRARELEKRLGRWMQTDPLWPMLSAYVYAFGAPILLTDPSGASASTGQIGAPFLLSSMKSKICSALRNLTQRQIDYVYQCIQLSKPHDLICDTPFSRSVLYHMQDLCEKGLKIKYDCCKDKPDVCADADGNADSCTIRLCIPKIWSSDCSDVGSGAPIGSIEFNIIHEMLHCAGIDHGTIGGLPALEAHECNDIFACCLGTVIVGYPMHKCRRVGT